MRRYLFSKDFMVLVNGSAIGLIKETRGIRQGDYFSTFLFTIVADVSSRMMFQDRGE